VNKIKKKNFSTQIGIAVASVAVVVVKKLVILGGA
jgi:hypothetical protein